MFLQKTKQAVLNFGESLYQKGLSVHQKKMREMKQLPTYESARILSVGNLSCGGTGKTPLVMTLADYLSQAGKKVAVLTRGYGGDESQELRERLKGVPVLVGKDRRKNAAIAVKEHGCDLLLLDDGFQHLAIRRDLDIVTVNATNPFGNGRMLPAGPLREPVAHLERAHCFVLTQSFLGRRNVPSIRQKLHEINPAASIFEADHAPQKLVDYRNGRTLPLDLVRGQKVATLAGIEDPGSFENTVNRLGATIEYSARFKDHHAFTRSEINEVFKSCKDCRVRYLVTTSKDSYRLRRILHSKGRLPTRVLILQIQLKLDDEEAFLGTCLGQTV